MTKFNCPAVLISAPASGQGKTLISAALAWAWRKQGLVVQAFKCGPDFIDGMILQRATGRPVYNLDLGMCGVEDGQALLWRAAQNADVLIIEGVMGLYDGVPSSAEIALAFNIPVALVIDASGMAQTFAAVARGLYDFNGALIQAGVIANKVGSISHATMLKDALPADIPWLGALVQDENFNLPERHLGLHMADEIVNLDDKIEAAAYLLFKDGNLALPPTVSFDTPSQQSLPALLHEKTIAVARDAAFCFIYAANIDCLISLGAKVIYFSLLNDSTLPEADAYWLPGGYPELHLNKISQNTSMCTSVQNAAKTGKPILAECGGMMVLSEALNDVAMLGLIVGHSQILSKLQGLGTQHLQTQNGSISAHTFHYGSFETKTQPAFIASSLYGHGEAVYKQGNITASFLHFYFASNPKMAALFFLP